MPPIFVLKNGCDILLRLSSVDGQRKIPSKAYIASIINQERKQSIWIGFYLVDGYYGDELLLLVIN
jgi:putative methionine-R-sulfoxide reductase with GAF domain